MKNRAHRLSVVLLLSSSLAAIAPAGAQERCFETVPALPWTGGDLGIVRQGSSSPLVGRPGFLLCSASLGFDPFEDSLRYLYQRTSGDFEITARLDRIEPAGLGGVMALWDGMRADEPYVAITVHRLPGGPYELRSSFRLDAGGKASLGNKPIANVELPIFLRVGREGTFLITSFSRDGRSFEDHIRVDGGGTGLSEFFFTAGMMQASENGQVPATALFGAADLVRREIPGPRLLRVDPPNSTLEGGEPVKLLGSGLAKARSVSLAGIEARIVDSSEEHVTVLPGEARRPVSGDVVVETDEGMDLLEDAFVYIGHSYLRGDFNRSGLLDLSDAVAGLNYLFQGGEPALCPDASDTNSDGKLDLSDEIYLLGFLFLGSRPPLPPYPDPGVPRGPSLPCGMPAAPEILDISQKVIGEGDVVTIHGRGFSREPERNIVLFGGSPAEILDASEDKLVVRATRLSYRGDTSVSVLFDIDDIAIPALNCRATKCGLDLTGILAIDPGLLVTLRPADGYRQLGISRVSDDAIALQIDRSSWDPYQSYDIEAKLLLPAIHGYSRGPRIVGFEYRRFSPDIRYGEWLQGLARRLEEEIGDEMYATPDEETSMILLRARKEISPFVVAERPWIDSLINVVVRPPIGKCGPTDIDPLLNPREFGWCRFEELVKPCNGYPAWEYFIPKQVVLSASNPIFPLAFPNQLTTGEKRVLYNKPAFCFVRKEKLYQQCTLDDLIDLGKSQIPHFPRSAIVIKTGWTSESSITMRGGDPSKYYSYVDDDGDRHYLELFHFTTKDIDKWFWATFWVPTPSDPGPPSFDCGVGGNADKPAGLAAPWSNYHMCVNIAENVACGNPNFAGPECPTSGEKGCTSCHKDATHSSSAGNIDLDFLFSVGSGPEGSCP
jgi:hypothetical protein